MWQELAGLAHERLHLAALETRLAGENLVVIIAALFRGMMPPLRLIPAKAA